MHSCSGKGNEPFVGELVAFVVGETVGVSVAAVGVVVVGEAVVGSLVVGATVGDGVGDRVGDLVGGVGVGGGVIGEPVGGLSQQPRCLEASFVRHVADDRN